MQLVTRRTQTEARFQKPSYGGEKGREHIHGEAGDCCNLCNLQFRGRTFYLEGRLHEWRPTDDLVSHIAGCLETWLPRWDLLRRISNQKVAIWGVSMTLPRKEPPRGAPYEPMVSEPCWHFRAVVALPVEVDWGCPWMKALTPRGQEAFAMYGLETLQFVAPYHNRHEEAFWEWTRRRITGEEDHPDGFSSSEFQGDLAQVKRALGISEQKSAYLRQVPITMNGEYQNVEPDVTARGGARQRLVGRSLPADTLPRYEQFEQPPSYTP